MVATINPEKAAQLLRDVGVESVIPTGEASFVFTLKDKRVLEYQVTGYTEGCDTCGYGAEPIISWYLSDGE